MLAEVGRSVGLGCGERVGMLALYIKTKYFLAKPKITGASRSLLFPQSFIITWHGLTWGVWIACLGSSLWEGGTFKSAGWSLGFGRLYNTVAQSHTLT